MLNNFNDSFNSPQFKALLKAYEDMVKNHKSSYFEADELIQIAEYYSGKKMAEASSEAIRYAQRLHPDDNDVNIYQAQILLLHNKFAEALELLDRIPEQDDREVIFTRATIYLRMDKKEMANEILQRIAFEEDYTVEVLTDAANVYLDEGLYDAAYEWLQKAYEKDPEYKELKAALISYYVNKKEYEKVVVLLNNMIEEDPYNIDLWLDLTRIYITQNEIDKASEAIDFAIAIDKYNPIAIETKGYICLMQDNPEKSIEMMERLIKDQKISPSTLQILLQSYMQLDRFEDAVLCSETMMKMPDVADYEIAIYGSIRAYCNLMLQHYDDCRKDIETVLKADKEYPNIYTVMGELELVDEKENEAKKHFAYAQLYAADPSETNNSIAMAFFRQGYLKDAISAFEELELDYPEEMKKNYYFMAYAYFFSHSPLQDTKKALVKGAYYMPKFTEVAKQLEDAEDIEEREFYRLAVEAKELVDKNKGIPLHILLGDYDDDPEDEIPDFRDI